MDPQLKKGIFNIFILQILHKQDMYGYDIIRITKEYFPETDESTIYAILRRLNNEGLTEMYCSESSNGPVRKYYRLTMAGMNTLEKYIDSWKKIESIFNDIGII